MSNKQIYKQCRFEKAIATGKLSTIAWIPSYGAKIGNVVDLERDDGEYDKGWTVVSVGGSRDIDELNLQRAAQKRWESVVK